MRLIATCPYWNYVADLAGQGQRVWSEPPPAKPPHVEPTADPLAEANDLASYAAKCARLNRREQAEQYGRAASSLRRFVRPTHTGRAVSLRPARRKEWVKA